MISNECNNNPGSMALLLKYLSDSSQSREKVLWEDDRFHSRRKFDVNQKDVSLNFYLKKIRISDSI